MHIITNTPFFQNYHIYLWQFWKATDFGCVMLARKRGENKNFRNY